MNKIIAPFAADQVAKLNEFQELGFIHPFTCCSKIGQHCERINGSGNGTLIATAKGWICPCGHFTQDWAYDFMIEVDELKKEYEDFKLQFGIGKSHGNE